MADDALYLLAQIYETHLNSTQKAKEYYERIILEYSNSLYVTQSRKRYNELTNKNTVPQTGKFSNDIVN